MLTRRTYRLWLACCLGLTLLLTACQPIQPMAAGAAPAAEEDRGNFPATTAVDDEWSQMKKIVDLPNGISLRYSDAPSHLSQLRGRGP